jgi:DNA-3-methyladenine glycosylase
MYGPPGRAYVYLVYGMYDCLNIVTEAAGRPAALLVRAVEPLAGIAEMRASRTRRDRERRRTRGLRPAPRPVGDERIAAGPGLVCAAFDLDRSLTGQDLFDQGAAIRLEPPPGDEPAPPVAIGPRVGIGYAGSAWASRPWRFAIAGHRSVSRPAPPSPPSGTPAADPG